MLCYIEEEEDELRREILAGEHASSSAWWIERDACREHARAQLKKWEPVFAVIRDWCGEDAVEKFDQVLELRNEVHERKAKELLDTIRQLHALQVLLDFGSRDT
jgi:hypothetical protein